MRWKCVLIHVGLRLKFVAAWTFKQRPYAYTIIEKHLIKRARTSRNKAEIIIKYRKCDRLQVIEASRVLMSSKSFHKELVYVQILKICLTLL